MQRSPVMVKFQQHSREKPDTAGGWMVALRYAHKNRRHQTMCQPLNKYLLLPVASQLRQMEQKLEHRPLTQRQSQQTTLYCTFFFVSSYFLFLVLLLENVESLIKNYFFFVLFADAVPVLDLHHGISVQLFCSSSNLHIVQDGNSQSVSNLSRRRRTQPMRPVHSASSHLFIALLSQ